MQLLGDKLAHGRFAGAHETDKRNVLNVALGAHPVELANLEGNRTQIFWNVEHRTPNAERRRECLRDAYGTLNCEIERGQGFLLQITGAFAEVGNGQAFGDADNGFANFFHHAADGATGFVGAGTLFVKFFAHATDGREGAFNVTDDNRETDFLRPPREAITAGHATPALNHACGFKVVQDLLEEPLGNVLLFGNGLDANDRLIVVQTENQQRSQGIFPSNREFHDEKQPTISTKNIKNKFDGGNQS